MTLTKSLEMFAYTSSRCMDLLRADRLYCRYLQRRQTILSYHFWHVFDGEKLRSIIHDMPLSSDKLHEVKSVFVKQSTRNEQKGCSDEKYIDLARGVWWSSLLRMFPCRWLVDKSESIVVKLSFKALPVWMIEVLWQGILRKGVLIWYWKRVSTCITRMWSRERA